MSAKNLIHMQYFSFSYEIFAKLKQSRVYRNCYWVELNEIANVKLRRGYAKNPCTSTDDKHLYHLDQYIEDIYVFLYL